jgi:KaiC/GvpD/RAD55 family RecA-like ATPase
MIPQSATVADAPHAHFVQFYKADEPSLNRNVASFLWDGLLRGDGLMVIATPQRRESLSIHLARLGADVTLARREGQLAMLDAQETLDRIMVGGEPHWERFQSVIADALKLAAPRVADARVCAYGEMVGLLWEVGQTTAAIQLEELWNRRLHRSGITLFCGYPIDVFANDFQKNHIHDVLKAHSHLMPTGSNGELRGALNRAMDELLGDRADEVRLSMKVGISAVNPGVPDAESSILWLRSHVPESAETILASARRLYEASLGLRPEGHSAAA